MAKQGGFKHNKSLARYAATEEEQSIRELVVWSNPFSTIATGLVIGIGAQVGFKARFQSFTDWRREFVGKLLTPAFHKERRSLLNLAKRNEIRAVLAIVILYAFGQHARAQEFSDIYCGQGLVAIKALRSQAEKCLAAIEPIVRELQDAPGLWPDEANELRQELIRVQQIVHSPSGKNCRNSAHRDVDYTLLHWITSFAGCKPESALPQARRPSRFRAASIGILRLLAKGMLGPLTRMEKTDCLSWAIVAELAAGARNPRSINTLITLYYESDKREAVWKQLRRHAEFHLGRRPTTESV